ncbi:MAG: hypothetical protein ACE5OZ_22535 [Candidatus Heimdallarchaeota archaeon]
MISERRKDDINLLHEAVSDVGDVAAVEPLSPSDNRNYKVRFHGRKSDIFVKVIDNMGDPDNPLTSHQMALEREFVGLNIFTSAVELLALVNIPKPISFQTATTSDGSEEAQMLFLPYLEELALENASTIIPHAAYISTEPIDSRTLNFAKTSALAHFEFIFEPHQKSLWHSSASEIRNGLNDQKSYLRRVLSREDALANILDFPYLWPDISSEFDAIHSKMISHFRSESSLSNFWLTLRPLSDRGTSYFENLSENFAKANRRVIVPGDRAPWNEAILVNDGSQSRPSTWQFDFEKWSEVPLARYLGQNIAALMHLRSPQIANTYALAFLIALGTEGLRPMPAALIEERMPEITEILISAAHYAAVFRIWNAASLIKVSKDIDGAKKALEQAKQLLRDPSLLLASCKQAITDSKSTQVFWEIRAQAGLKIFKEWDGKLPGYLEEHVKHAAKIFKR